MKTVIVIFFLVVAVALVALPWRNENGTRAGLRWRIGVAVLCAGAALLALVAEDPFD